MQSEVVRVHQRLLAPTHMARATRLPTLALSLALAAQLDVVPHVAHPERHERISSLVGLLE
jgi:hypothetical protein